ncbi:MAG: UDPGP type 1 family protein [Phycisphaeraceae bacterium]|nr:UDPGP type 1 family protein [Phycisphaeraceae bacterium]MCW5763931.1 UDPGP type 1 family protein [Phycisphaeraceae bacterium]
MTLPSTVPSIEELRPTLSRAGQEHVLRFVDELSAEECERLAAQIAAIDLEEIPELVSRYVLSSEAEHVPGDLEPANYYPLAGEPAWDVKRYKAMGEDLLSEGAVACFTVAGGQGSRLGYEGPKGCYPTGSVTSKPLFQIFAEKIRGAERTYDEDVPWYIMTSPLNHDETVRFFVRNEYFGLDAERVMFFMQGTMPSFECATGRMLMSGKGTIATNPDGHGGSLRALARSGALADMRRRGVEHISYFQVDNPNVQITDPVFIGLHVGAPDSTGEMSSKMIPKSGPEEKVGVFCRSGGKTRVIEYSDLPRELAHARDERGRLRFVAGSIAIHMLSVGFVEKLNSDAGFALPYHRAVKKVRHVDLDTGEMVEPREANAVKLERFVFDAIALAGSSIVMETDRVEEFAPVKNAEGVDSIITSKELQSAKAARWLEAAGVVVPRRDDGSPDCVLEIGGLTAIAPERLDRSELPGMIEAGSQVAI